MRVADCMTTKLLTIRADKKLVAASEIMEWNHVRHLPVVSGRELSLTAVGRTFGRDRSTVANACKRVEDAREASEFNHAVGMMER